MNTAIVKSVEYKFSNSYCLSKTPKKKVWVSFLLLKTWTICLNLANPGLDPFYFMNHLSVFLSLSILPERQTEFFIALFLSGRCLMFSLPDLWYDQDKSRGLWVIWGAHLCKNHNPFIWNMIPLQVQLMERFICLKW